MQLHVREANSADFPPLEALVLESFEPITWQKKLDATYGPLNGCDWQERWHSRLAKIFATQIVLVGEVDSERAAMATATIDHCSALAFLDVLAVSRKHQGQGLGRQMLREAIEHYRALGCKYVHLDCLTDNDAGNALYEAEGFREVARHIHWFKPIGTP